LDPLLESYTPQKNELSEDEYAAQIAITDELFHRFPGIELAVKNQFHIARLHSHQAACGAIRGISGKSPRGTPGLKRQKA